MVEVADDIDSSSPTNSDNRNICVRFCAHAPNIVAFQTLKACGFW